MKEAIDCLKHGHTRGISGVSDDVVALRHHVGDIFVFSDTGAYHPGRYKLYGQVMSGMVVWPAPPAAGVRTLPPDVLTVKVRRTL
jgi:hypothetical protein